MTQETSEKVVTVGGLSTFYNRLTSLFCSEDSVDAKLAAYSGNSQKVIHGSAFSLHGANSATALLSVNTVSPSGGSPYNVFTITSGHEVKTLATTDIIDDKADKVSVISGSGTSEFLTTPVLTAFFGIYTVAAGTGSGQGSPAVIPSFTATASLVGRIMYIYGNSSLLSITGYTVPGFYMVTAYSTGLITEATFVCAATATGVYLNLSDTKFYRLSERDATLVALNIGGSTTIIQGENVDYDVADDSDIEAIFEELGLNE